MKKIFIVAFLCLSLGSLHAQSASEMEAVLAAPAVTWTQAAYFILIDQDKTQQESPGEQSWEDFRSQGWMEPLPDPTAQPTAQELSLVVARAYGYKDGFLYNLMPSGRYALRELVFAGVVPSSLDPTGTVSGTEFFKILGKAGN